MGILKSFNTNYNNKCLYLYIVTRVSGYNDKCDSCLLMRKKGVVYLPKHTGYLL